MVSTLPLTVGKFLLHHPLRTIATVGFVLAETFRNRSLHTWLRFAQAVLVAQHARGAGVTRFHAHFADGTTRIAMLAAMMTGLPYSFTTHARDIFRAGINERILGDKVLRADFVVCVSQYNKDHLQRRTGGPAAQLHVIYNGVDLDRFRPGGNPTAGLVMAVGRLVPKKGFPDLVAACQAIVLRSTPIRLVIIGAGPMESALAEQAKRGGVALSLPGVLPQDVVAETYGQAAVVVQPSIVPLDGNIDSLPTVLLEAMASGRPVVSTRVGGIPEVIDDNENGLLVAPGDIAALRSAIERVLGDLGLQERLGKAARKKAEDRFDVRRNAALLYRLFAGPARVDSSPSYESSLPQH